MSESDIEDFNTEDFKFTGKKDGLFSSYLCDRQVNIIKNIYTQKINFQIQKIKGDIENIPSINKENHDPAIDYNVDKTEKIQKYLSKATKAQKDLFANSL